MAELQALNKEEKIWNNFIYATKSPETKDRYIRALKAYMKYQGIERYSGLLDRTIEDIEDSIKDYILSMRNRGCSTSHINNHRFGIKLFYDMNGFGYKIDWKRLGKFMGEQTPQHEYRSYTREEIDKLLKVCDPKLRVCVLVMKSSGVRIGALPTMKVGHLTRRDDCYQIPVYKNTSGYGQYIGFCDPEAVKAIDDYLAWRERCGEDITPESPLIRKDFDSQDSLKSAKEVFPVKKDALRKDMELHLVKAGLRTVMPDTVGIKNRKEVMANHGFRSYFEGALRHARIGPVIRDKLRGKSKKSDIRLSYNLAEVDELFEEYKKAIPFLTIDQTNILKKELGEKTDQLSEIDMIKLRNKDDMRLLQQEIKQLQDQFRFLARVNKDKNFERLMVAERLSPEVRDQISKAQAEVYKSRMEEYHKEGKPYSNRFNEYEESDETE